MKLNAGIIETIIEKSSNYKDGETGIYKCCLQYCTDNNLDKSLAEKAAALWCERESLIHGIPLEVILGKAKLPKQPLNYKLIDDIEVDGIDTRDYPDFCDAYISSASYNGNEMTEEQLEQLNDDREFVYEQIINHLY